MNLENLGFLTHAFWQFHVTENPGGLCSISVTLSLLLPGGLVPLLVASWRWGPSGFVTSHEVTERYWFNNPGSVWVGREQKIKLGLPQWGSGKLKETVRLAPGCAHSHNCREVEIILWDLLNTANTSTVEKTKSGDLLLYHHNLCLPSWYSLSSVCHLCRSEPVDMLSWIK